MTENVYPDSEPWATEGDLEGRIFSHIAYIKLLELFTPTRLSVRDIVGNKEFQTGLVPLSAGEYKKLLGAIRQQIEMSKSD